MKNIMLSSVVITLITFSGCNNSDKSSKESDMSKMSTDTTKKVAADNTHIVELTHTFNNVDAKLASSLKTVVDHYLHIKNALVNNDGKEATNGGKAMADALEKIDKSLLTADQ